MNISLNGAATELKEDLVAHLAACITRTVNDLKALSSLVEGFVAKLQRPPLEAVDHVAAVAEPLDGRDLSSSEEAKEEDDDPVDSPAESDEPTVLRTYQRARPVGAKKTKKNGRGNKRGPGNNNNSSSVKNKNDETSQPNPQQQQQGPNEEDPCGQFVSLVAAWSSIDGNVKSELVPLLLSVERFVTQTQLDRWKRKQCWEVFYVPSKSGSEEPIELTTNELQEDLINLQLLYAMLWSQVTVRLPRVTTLLDCVEDTLKKSKQLLSNVSSTAAAAAEALAADLFSDRTAPSTPVSVMRTAMAVQKRMMERCLVIENQPGPLVKKERRTTVRVRLLLNPAHLPPGSNPQMVAYLLTEEDAASFHRTKIIPAECKMVMRSQSFVPLVGPAPSSPSPGGAPAPLLASPVQRYGVELSKLLIEKSHVDRSKAQGAPCRKYCLLFKADGFKLHLPSDFVPAVYLTSQPFVITTHTNQEPESWAPIFWDRAFQEPGRVPFHVPAHVEWKRGFEFLSLFFESRSGRWLFDRPDTESYFAALLKQETETEGPVLAYDRLITRHPKSAALGSGSIWKWFFGILQLLNQEVAAPGSHDHHTQKVVTSSFNMMSPLGEPELRQLWRQGLVFGFISRLDAQRLLLPEGVPLGTFLIRFSGSEFGSVVVTWKQPGSAGPVILNIIWSKDHLRKQSLLARLKFLVKTTRQLPLIRLYIGENDFRPIDEALGDLWEKLEKADGVRGRGSAAPRPGYVGHYDSIIDKIDLSEICVADDDAVVAPLDSISVDIKIEDKTRQDLSVSIAQFPPSSSVIRRELLQRLVIPKPPASLPTPLSISGSLSSSVKLESSSPSPTSHHHFSSMTPAKKRLRTLLFNRSLSLPQPASGRTEDYPSPSSQPRTPTTMSSAAHGLFQTSTPSKDGMTPSEHQVVETLLSLRGAESALTTTDSIKSSNRRKRKILPADAKTGEVAARRLMAAPSASFPLPVSSPRSSSSPFEVSSRFSVRSTAAAAAVPVGAAALTDKRSISTQERQMVESLLSLSASAPRRTPDSADVECGAIDLTLNSENSATSNGI